MLGPFVLRNCNFAKSEGTWTVGKLHFSDKQTLSINPGARGAEMQFSDPRKDKDKGVRMEP